MNNYTNQYGYSNAQTNNSGQYDYINGYRNNYVTPNSYVSNQDAMRQNQSAQSMYQQTSPQINNNMQFALVPSMDVAEKATAEKGQTIYMMNQNKPEIYAKAADVFGLQSMRYFKLLEFNPNEERITTQNGQTSSSYVPIEEYNRFVQAASNEIEMLKRNIAELSASAQKPMTLEQTNQQTTNQTNVTKNNTVQNEQESIKNYKDSKIILPS